MLVHVTIPVFNEEKQLAATVARLETFLATQAQFEWEVIVANNGSTDRTLEIARQLARANSRVRVLELSEKGRGGALKRAWLDSASEVLSYMDVDLSTDLAAFPALVDAVASDEFDLAIGSRLLPDSHTTRSWRRDLISRSYNGLARLLLRTRLSDLQCGFKAIRREAARTLLPLVADTGWFFDTELLVLAERMGYHICEIPVRWVEDLDSRVKLLSTALADLKGLIRLRRNLAKGSSD
jgi:glycosyltransferase involved in cell wall biosynthesis